MSDLHGAFVWYELGTTDVPAAQSFYEKVIGWTAKPMPGMDYITFHAGEHGAGGLMALPQEVRDRGVPPHWTGYVWVDDVDAAAAKVKSLGGQLYHGPDDIPAIGRFAIAADPGGASIALFKGASAASSEPPPPHTLGLAGWRELMAYDGEAAMTFYGALFGWSADGSHDMGPMGQYRLFAHKGVQTGGMMTKPPAMPFPAWGYYFNVDSAKAAAERVKAAGGQIVNGPMQVPNDLWIVQATDPQGAFFAMVSVAE